jgi:dTDP-4-amino-4,6-dideoxygalactose transaminase
MEHGIQAALHYPVPIHLQDAYKERALRGSDTLHTTEALYKNILSLPMYPELTDDQVMRVISSIHEWLRGL